MPPDHQALHDLLMETFFSERRTRQPIVIVHDDPDLAELLREGIKEAGYRPVYACNGREALAAITHEKPAMIFIDIEMPDLDGSDLLAKIDRSPALARIPRALLTGDSRFPSGAASAWPVFLKPVQLDHLLMAIQRFVE